MSSTIWVVGSINDDTTLRVRSHPNSGQTVTARSAGSDLGGKGANQAIALARAGADVRFIGAVGDDSAGSDLRGRLASEGVETAGIRTVDGDTGRAVVLLADDGANTIVIVPGANGELRADDVTAAMQGAAAGDVLLAQLETAPDSLEAALTVAKRVGVFTVVNAAPFERRVLEVLDRIDLLVVNEHELDDTAAALHLDGDRRSNAQTIAHRFNSTVLCTLGADGSFAATADDLFEVSSDVVNAVDTTGAGDTYIGYLVAGLSTQLELRRSMRWATSAAAIAVTRPGAARAIPTADEVGIPTTA